MTTADQDILVPNPLTSDRQYLRFHHLDVPELDGEELMDELHYLQPLLWGLNPQHWLRERVRMIESELIKRGIQTTYKSSPKRTAKPARGVDL